MSAMPERLQENTAEQSTDTSVQLSVLRGADIPDEMVLGQILHAGRNGLAVVAAGAAQFHKSVQTLFNASLVDLTELSQITAESEPAVSSSKVISTAQNRYPIVVLDTTTVNADDVARVLALLPKTVPVVVLHPDGQQPQTSTLTSNVICCLAHNEHLGENWAVFNSVRQLNHSKLVILDYADSSNAKRIEQFLSIRNLQVVTAAKRATTTFVCSPSGCQILLIECGESTDKVVQYIRQIRLLHETDAVGIVVTGELQDASRRCEILEAGADELQDDSLSDQELLLKLEALSHRQIQIQKIRHDAYRFPGSVAFNAEYLSNVGNKLYASAKRDVITIALGAIRVVFIETEQQTTVSREEREEILRRIAEYFVRNLRETDLFAQSGERDFYALVTCVGRNNISRVFGRLSSDVRELVENATEGRIKVRLDMGVTGELGLSFKSMIDRAQQALTLAERNPNQLLVVN